MTKDIIGFLLVFGLGTAGLLFGRSKLPMRAQIPVILGFGTCWAVLLFASPYLIHNHALNNLPEMAVAALQFSAAFGFIGIPCAVIGWIAGLFLRRKG
jgi:hypothetical protein